MSLGSGVILSYISIVIALLSLILYIVGCGGTDYWFGFPLFDSCQDCYLDNRVNAIRAMLVIGLLFIAFSLFAQIFYMVSGIGNAMIALVPVLLSGLSALFGMISMAVAVSFFQPVLEVGYSVWGSAFGCATAAWIFALIDAILFFMASRMGGGRKGQVQSASVPS